MRKARARKPKTKPRAKAAPADQYLRDLVQQAMDRQDHGPTAVESGSGVPRTTLSRWLGGRRNIRVRELAKVLKYLQIEVKPYGEAA